MTNYAAILKKANVKRGLALKHRDPVAELARKRRKKRKQ